MEWWQRIAFAREAAGLTQDALAKLLNADQSTVAKYETGEREPRLAVIEIIAKATGVSPCWIAFGIGGGPEGQ
jgi:transcriptional regulator with XRE-family HTH domain